MWNAQVTRARDRTADTAVFSFLREHIKGTRARLERMRDVTQQSIRVLQGQMQQGRAWVAELLLLAREHWQGGVAVEAIEQLAIALEQVEQDRVRLLVSALERLLETIEQLLANYDRARDEKLRLYWARSAAGEAADKVKHYRRKINDGKHGQEAKMAAALHDVMVSQRSFQRLNASLAGQLVLLEAQTAVALMKAAASYVCKHVETLQVSVKGLTGHAEMQPLQQLAEQLDDAAQQHAQDCLHLPAAGSDRPGTLWHSLPLPHAGGLGRNSGALAHGHAQTGSAAWNTSTRSTRSVAVLTDLPPDVAPAAGGAATLAGSFLDSGGPTVSVTPPPTLSRQRSAESLGATTSNSGSISGNRRPSLIDTLKGSQNERGTPPQDLATPTSGSISGSRRPSLLDTQKGSQNERGTPPQDLARTESAQERTGVLDAEERATGRTERGAPTGGSEGKMLLEWLSLFRPLSSPLSREAPWQRVGGGTGVLLLCPSVVVHSIDSALGASEGDTGSVASEARSHSEDAGKGGVVAERRWGLGDLRAQNGHPSLDAIGVGGDAGGHAGRRPRPLALANSSSTLPGTGEARSSACLGFGFAGFGLASLA